MKVSRACHALSIPKRERDIRTSPPSLVVIPIRRRMERDLSDAICALLAANPRIAIARSLAALRRLGMTPPSRPPPTPCTSSSPWHFRPRRIDKMHDTLLGWVLVHSNYD